mmetsp:Transcript_10120/g.24464  ORF Transcript_10120/g.24464 Transcript_10120/m.24464 type:complete len:236 (+) Transcript_10120:336-1043(+)
MSCDGLATSLFHDERHRCTFVQKSKLAVLVLVVSWICEDAAIEQCAVNIADHGADVAKGVGFARFAFPVTDVRDVLPHWLVPLCDVGLVAGVDLAPCRNLNRRSSHHEFADAGVQGEADNAMAKGEDQLGGSGIQHIAGSDQGLSGLQRACETPLLLVRQAGRQIFGQLTFGHVRLLKDSEDGSNRNAYIHIAAAIQGVKNTDILSSLGKLLRQHGDQVALALSRPALHRLILLL